MDIRGCFVSVQFVADFSMTYMFQCKYVSIFMYSKTPIFQMAFEITQDNKLATKIKATNYSYLQGQA